MLPRSYLFVPGHRPERFEKAAQSGADAVILDLEDAVSPDDKLLAREHVRSYLQSGANAYVRINSAASEWHAMDLCTLSACDGLLGIVLPKAEAPDVLHQVAVHLPATKVLLPLIESALGFEYLHEICAAPKVERVLFGTLDFQVDTRIRGDAMELLYFRSRLTLASRVAGIGAPADGVTTSIEDEELIRNDATRARNMGFGAKLCIHPRQIVPVHAAFSYTQVEFEWAQRVMEAVKASGGAATTVDEKMVDLPVFLSAREIIEQKAMERKRRA
jgi:citrate lyase subunit beta/citryl-CoA lyase